MIHVPEARCSRCGGSMTLEVFGWECSDCFGSEVAGEEAIEAVVIQQETETTVSPVNAIEFI